MYISSKKQYDLNNYKMLRPTKDFNKAYLAEFENILNKTSNSQVEGMFKDIPYVIVTNEQNKADQTALSKLGNEATTKVIDSKSSSEIIGLEKPEIILDSVSYILKNIPFKESSNP